MILNAAFYRFVALPESELAPLRVKWRAFCREAGLRGTVIFSPEGINGGVAGAEGAVRLFQAELRRDPRFAAMEFRESRSERAPFQRLYVKIKREVVPCGDSAVDPSRETGRRLAPRELKRWLDEGKEFTLLDARNDYEISEGTFEGAERLSIRHFRDFASALRRSRPPAEKPVVLFCTGGIRCEKASAIALREGLGEVYQLDGGILRYFEECGTKHFRGRCFVFDERVSVTGAAQHGYENG